MRFEDFTQARLPALLRYATLLCGERESARDLVQEVLTRAFARWRRIGAVDEPYAYVREMLTNEFLSQRRRRRLVTVPLTFEALDGPAAPVQRDYVTEASARDAMWQRLAGLPPQQRATVVLRYYEGLTDVEIADVLGCRPATVRSNAARALAALRIDLTDSSFVTERRS
jgi:RNA polymerase sigma-70 factor (sigma-E family)